jgi:hypothetical protein
VLTAVARVIPEDDSESNGEDEVASAAADAQAGSDEE